MAAAHESSEHASLVGSRRLDETSLEQLHDDIVHIARGYVHTPPLTAFSDALRVRNLAARSLDRTSRPQQENDLYLVIGQACGMLATASFDLGHLDAATEQARSALLYGNHIGHDGLRSWSRGMQALIAYWSGMPGEAVRFVRDAQSYAPSGTAMVRLRCIEARALSYFGDVSGTARAIEAADAARGEVSGTDDLHDQIGGEFSFDPARQARCNASAYLQLGQADAAIRKAESAIELCVGMPADTRSAPIVAQARADLASARLMREEFDGARAALADVFDVPPERRIEGLTRRLQRLRAMLAVNAYQASREARELGDQIEDFTAQAVARAVSGALGMC